MRKMLFVLLFPSLVLSFLSLGKGYIPAKHMEQNKQLGPKVVIEPIIEDPTLNIRAIEVVEAFKGAAFATSDGRFGAIVPKGTFNGYEQLNLSKSDDFEAVLPVTLRYDSIIPNFRALSVNKRRAYGISIGSPALIYKLDLDLEENRIVYVEHHPNAFYDAMEFWNDQEGLAIGDPTDSCMSIVITRDGGKSWEKLSCDVLPVIKEGEAAFAASDTNIAIVGEETWIATGGKSSRILYSPDKGVTWQVFETPIIQGKATTGIYSIDFYDAENGFAIGGDYTQPDVAIANKIRTTDGGQSWEVMANEKSPGYRSCVQYVPNSKAEELVAIGFKGIDYSSDSGQTWKHLSDEGFYTIRFLNDSVAFATGQGRVSKLTFSR